MENRIRFFNTLTRNVELFVPNEDGKVKMYTCGPTVYHYAHIGNLRSYIMEDILEKTLRYVGYDVKRVMNITDVGHLSSDADTGEDKMLKGAKREHKTVMEIAKFYTDAFLSDCSKLNIRIPDVVEPATNCIPEFINMVSVLLEKGYAYIAGENVYFDTSKLKDYYVFSSQSEKELMVGVRDDVSEIGDAVVEAADECHANVVLTCGGTGLSMRDVTPEATRAVCDRDVPGIAEAIRAYAMTKTRRAMGARAS